MEHHDAATLLTTAREAVATTRPWVAAEARISHVGFRSSTAEGWKALLEALGGQGEICMTYKPDGREIPFVKLTEPLVIGSEALSYIEVPAPKPEPVDEPGIIVAYMLEGGNEALIRDGYDVRQQPMHAENFIERDKGRTI